MVVLRRDGEARRRVPQRTHWANRSDSPRPEGENRIVRKCMAELGISGEAMAGAGRPMPSTTGEAGFGEKGSGSPNGTRTYDLLVDGGETSEKPSLRAHKQKGPPRPKPGGRVGATRRYRLVRQVGSPPVGLQGWVA